jgi:hypothetical protein
VPIEPLPGADFGEFVLRELLGTHGRESLVYRAGHPRLGTDLVVKVVDLAHEELLDAAAAVAEIDHPGLLPVLGRGREGDHAWLAMPFVTGVTLGTWLGHTRLSPSDIVSLVRQGADVLQELHAAGLTHGDVKPENILVTTWDGRPHRLQAHLIDPVPARPGFFTPGYCAPEQLAGEAASAASDQFSLAATAYACFTGSAPFPAAVDLDAVYARERSSVPSVGGGHHALAPGLVAAVDVVLACGMSNRALHRYASCSGFAAALESVVRSFEPGYGDLAGGPTWVPLPGSHTWSPGTVIPASPRWNGPPAAPVAPTYAPAPAVPAQPGPTTVHPLAAPRAAASAEAVGAPGAGPPGEDQVDCSVFAAPTARPGSTTFVQVFVHLPEQAGQASAMASEFDDRAHRRGVRTLEVPITPGERLTFVLRMGGCSVPEPVQQLRWRGRPSSVQFEALVPPDFPIGEVTVGHLEVARDGIPLGDLKFTIRVTTYTDGRVEPSLVGDHATRFRRAFISYASTDRAAVLARLQVLRAAGIEYFQDIDMEPGERWERELYRRIDDADLFLLFWSQAAKDSTWVHREVQYALERADGCPEIRPVVLEGPPVPPPWEELSTLHFDDRLLMLMAVAGR